MHFHKKIALIKTLLIALACYAQGLSADMYLDCPVEPCQEPACGQAFVEGEFLYWRAYQGGLESCTALFNDNVTASDGSVISRFRGKSESLHFQWRPAYRIGLGYISNAGWGVAAYWTDFHSRANGHRSALQNQRWRLNFQQVDVLVGYTFCGEACFSFRPFIGVRGAKINQKLQACRLYSDRSIQGQEYSKSEFAGIGPVMGIEANVNVGGGFSLFADVATSILYGNDNVRFRKFEQADNASYFQVNQHLNGYQTVLDAAVGIAYETRFFDTLSVLFKLSAEHHCYFDFNRLGSHGDLSLDGGTFSAAITF